MYVIALRAVAVERSGWSYERTPCALSSAPLNAPCSSTSTSIVFFAISDILERASTRPDVVRRRSHEHPEALLLQDVRAPTCSAGTREHRGSERRRHLGDVEHDRRPVLDVRPRMARALLRDRLVRDLLELLRDCNARRAELLRDALQHTRPRILCAVYAMAEAHDPLSAREGFGDPLLRIAAFGDGVEHRQHARRGAAVQRARERANCGRERRAGVGAGGRDDPRRERRGVETVLGGANPICVDRARMLLVHLAPPREEEALGRSLACHDRVLGHRRQVGAARRLRDDRERRSREAAEVLLRPVVVDVDELAEIPAAAQARERRLQVADVVPRALLEVAVRCGEPWLERLVDEPAPDLFERDMVDEVLDVDAAIPELAALLVGLGDFRLEGDHTCEPWTEFGHA